MADLTAAVEAAAEAWWTANRMTHEPQWADAIPVYKHGTREELLPAVTAAAAVIEAQVRARIAADLEEARDRYITENTDADGVLDDEDYHAAAGMTAAARTARGESA